MAKKSKNNEHIPDHILKIIRVTPEQTEEFMKRNKKYTIYPRPEGVKNPKNKLFCPFCNEFVTFSNKRENEGSYKRCPNCSISDNDFDVKNANPGMWGKLGKK